MRVGWLRVFRHPAHHPVGVRSRVREEFAQSGRGIPFSLAVVKDEGDHGQFPVATPEFLVVPDQALGGQTAVDGRPESHMPLGPALEFQQKDQVGRPVRRSDAPGHVGVAAPELLVNQLGGQRLEGAVVDPAGPLGDVTADE